MGLFDIFTDQNAQDAARDQITSLGQAQSEGQGYLSTGRNDLQTSYAAGLQPLQTTYNGANAGANSYADATGVNGTAGNTRAVNNFQAGPGYNFTRDQGIQNVDRNQAAMGALNSGNTDKAVADYTTGLANNTWQQYVQSLQPFLGQQTQAGGQIASTNASLGGALNANDTTSANMIYGTKVAQGNAAASADLAGNQASANGVNAIMGGAQMLAGFL